MKRINLVFFLFFLLCCCIGDVYNMCIFIIFPYLYVLYKCFQWYISFISYCGSLLSCWDVILKNEFLNSLLWWLFFAKSYILYMHNNTVIIFNGKLFSYFHFFFFKWPTNRLYIMLLQLRYLFGKNPMKLSFSCMQKCY